MDYIELLKKYCREGGKIALDLLDSHSSELKADRSIVTEADKKISDLAYTMLAPIAGTANIMTEEALANFEALREKKEVPPGELLVVIDPIDGTRNYAHQIPIFGISVGILKERCPWIGMVYFPVLDELFYSDGESSFFVREAFRGTPRELLIEKKAGSPAFTSASESAVPAGEATGGTSGEEAAGRTVSNFHLNSIVIASENLLKKYRWDFSLCNIEILSCAVASLSWPLIGRGDASFFGAHPWDLAGCWPILRNAGFEMRRLSDGRVLDRFDFDDWGAENWRIKEHHVMCRVEDFEVLKGNLERSK
jgi:fructose-1,6-bisphosphatase/inositol monophosphatase family enzyme